MSDIEAQATARRREIGQGPDDTLEEVEVLKQTGRIVLVWLGSVTLACGIGLAIVIRPEDEMTAQRLAILGLLAGGLGSAIAALVSAAERMAHGWELESGEKVPPVGPTDRFVRRMVPLFAVRPLLGAGAGVLAYAAVVGGLLVASRDGDAEPRTETVLLFAILAGLFAKTLIERLKDTFDHFLGKD